MLPALIFEEFDSTAANPKPIPDLWETWIPKKDISITKRTGVRSRFASRSGARLRTDNAV